MAQALMVDDVTKKTLKNPGGDPALWLGKLARLGYAAKGTVYAIVGALSAVAALHHRHEAADRRDAFAFILHQPFGKMALLIIALGLAGYAVWRIIGGFADSEDRGSQLKAVAVRVASIVRGIVYGIVAFEVFRLALGHSNRSSGSDSQARHWTAKTMELPSGRWLVGVVSLIVVGTGCYQIYRATKTPLSKHLQGRIHPMLVAISRFGIAARGALFLIIGSSIFKAAVHHNPGSAHGTTGAMRTLAAQPYGSLVFLAAGLGLLAYGIYGFVNARYRRIEV